MEKLNKTISEEGVIVPLKTVIDDGYGQMDDSVENLFEIEQRLTKALNLLNSVLYEVEQVQDLSSEEDEKLTKRVWGCRNAVLRRRNEIQKRRMGQ